MITAYPKIYHPNHRALATLFDGPVVVEEKIDGSQFSMSRTSPLEVLECRSKGVMIDLDNPGMFALACVTARCSDLRPGWVYRGEFLAKPKHNTLAYDRVPAGNIMIFDITREDGTWLDWIEKEAEAIRIGLECVPHFGHFFGGKASMDDMRLRLGRPSILGGCAIEGVVVKNYMQFTPMGDIPLMKIVDEAFKELHKGDWGNRNPSRGDIIEQIAARYCHEGRWKKAVQHLRENGTLKDELSDIGPLIAEAQRDLKQECADDIAKALCEHFWRNISKGATKGLPEWYRAQLENAE